MDFGEVERKYALAGKEVAAPKRSGTQLIEYFWLCDDCAASLTLELTDDGQVDLSLLNAPMRKPAVSTPKTHNRRRAAAS